MKATSVSPGLRENRKEGRDPIIRTAGAPGKAGA
jgi:hypothetical protein